MKSSCFSGSPMQDDKEKHIPIISMWSAFVIITANGLRVGDVALCCACGKAILPTRCCTLP
ncbi:MAG TPA: hypothetical protein PLU51_10965 [Bacteroidia bacterium]|nr:hypothetical protein [Bacteroidia bacterium]